MLQTQTSCGMRASTVPRVNLNPTRIGARNEVTSCAEMSANGTTLDLPGLQQRAMRERGAMLSPENLPIDNRFGVSDLQANRLILIANHIKQRKAHIFDVG